MKPPKGYEALYRILCEALEQSASGKGRERHASGEPWEEQPIVEICRWLGSNHGTLFQAIKKLRESARLRPEAARREMLGAIVYTAAAIYYLEEAQHGREEEGELEVGLEEGGQAADFCGTELQDQQHRPEGPSSAGEA